MQRVSATMATMGAKFSQLASQASTHINSALVAIKGHGLNAINWAKQHPGIAAGIGGSTVVVLISGLGYYGVQRSRARQGLENKSEETLTSGAGSATVSAAAGTAVTTFWAGVGEQGLNKVEEMITAADLVPAITPKTKAACEENAEVKALIAKKDLFQATIQKGSKHFGNVFVEAVKELKRAWADVADQEEGDGCKPADLNAFKLARDNVKRLMAWSDVLKKGDLTIQEIQDTQKLVQTSIAKKAKGVKKLFPSLNVDEKLLTRDQAGDLTFKRANNQDFDVRLKAALAKFHPLVGKALCNKAVAAATAYGDACASWLAPKEVVISGTFGGKSDRKSKEATETDKAAREATKNSRAKELESALGQLKTAFELRSSLAMHLLPGLQAAEKTDAEATRSNTGTGSDK